MDKRMIPFFIIMLGAYIAVNIYLYIRCCQALSLHTGGRIVLGIVLLFLASAYILSHIIGRKLPFSLTSFMQIVGTTWYFVMLYALIAVLLIDIVRIANHFFHFFPAAFYTNYACTKLWVFGGVTTIIAVLAVTGYVRFSHPRVTTMEWNIAGQHPQNKEMRIAVVSDLHLGYIIKKPRLQKYVEQINDLHPDAVLMVGDVMDNDPKPVIHQHMDEEFRRLQAPKGIFAVTGNHEYIGNVEIACDYIQQAGITMLRDSVVRLDSGLYVVGREDRSDRSRKTLPELLQQVESGSSIILMDHQPYNLDESEALGVNVHLSGHTHDGQFFPINLIARRMYEISYGFKQKGATHVYVTSGIGLWGPMIRLGTISEIVLLKIKY